MAKETVSIGHGKIVTPRYVPIIPKVAVVVTPPGGGSPGGSGKGKKPKVVVA
jgi:hypothetical protein